VPVPVPVPVPEAWIDCVQREGGYPGVSELGAMLSCTGQKIREWIRMFRFPETGRSTSRRPVSIF